MHTGNHAATSMPRSRASVVHHLLVFYLLASFLLGVAQPAAAANGPDLRMRPGKALPGEVVTARGKHLPPGAIGEVRWGADGELLGSFVVDTDGRFELDLTVPTGNAGAVTIVATADGVVATDDFVRLAPAPDRGTSLTPDVAAITTSSTICPTTGARTMQVATGLELSTALASAEPGDLILLADGTYRGLFTADRSGTPAARISVCGSRNAVIDGGDIENGYALHITGDYWTVQGITVTNALKGVMLDSANFTELIGLSVHDIGHEAVHFRTNSSDNVLAESEIYSTGLKKEKFGEGVYIGSAVSNWKKYTDGEPDRSDRNQILRNVIHHTTSENIDIKEGTTGGLVEGNRLSGDAITGADSWVDVKGNDYLIRDNIGEESPRDGFQTHVINDMGWGYGNRFEGNTAIVNGDGYGFYIHDPETSANSVSCDSVVAGAAMGDANLACT